MEFYPTLPADASPGAGGMDAPGVMPGIVAVRSADLRRPGRGGVSALVTVPPAGWPVTSGEELVFCHQVTVAPAVVRRSGEVQAGGWLPDHVTLGILEAHLPDGEIEELVEDFGCAEERQRLLPAAMTVRPAAPRRQAATTGQRHMAAPVHAHRPSSGRPSKAAGSRAREGLRWLASGSGTSRPRPACCPAR